MTRLGKTCLAIFFSAYAVVFSIAISNEYLPKFLVPAMQPSFADLRIITSASECFQNSSWSLILTSCDPWGRPFNYPSLWVTIFSRFRLTQKATDFIGVMQIFLLALLFAIWVFRGFKLLVYHTDRKLLFVFTALVVVSPPFLLLLERGNVDSWIFAGLSLVSYLMISGKFYLPIGLLGFLGALKVYPFAVFAYIAGKRTFPSRLVFTLLVMAISVLSLAAEWQIILSRSLTTWNSISYGSSIIPLLIFQFLGFEESKPIAAIVGWTIFASLVFLLSKFLRVRLTDLRAQVQTSTSLKVPLVIFGAPFLFSFLVGASYDLRLVLLLPVIICLFVLSATINQQILLVGTVLSIMYGGQLTSSFGNFGFLINMCSDFILTFFSAFLLLLIFPNTKGARLI